MITRLDCGGYPNFPPDGAVDRAGVGDFNQSGALNLIESARQPDLPVDAFHRAALTGSVGAVGVASPVGEPDGNVVQ
jgi:hypothetical protein